MDFKQLEYFCALAREQHFAKAANSCHVTQPTLSNSIKKLENELNTELVVRGHHFIALTEEGQTVLQQAEQLLAGFHNLKQQLASSQGKLTGCLKIGVVPQCQLDIMPLIYQFRQLHPQVNIQLSVLTNQQILDQLANHAIDVGLGFHLNNQQLKQHKLNIYPQGIAKVAALLTPQAAKQLNQTNSPANKLALIDIIKFPLCLLSQDMQFRQFINQTFSQQQVNPNIVFETNSLFHLINAVKTGIGCALVSLETAKTMELTYVEVAHPFQIEQTILINRKTNSSPLSNAFVLYAEQTKQP